MTFCFYIKKRSLACFGILFKKKPSLLFLHNLWVRMNIFLPVESWNSCVGTTLELFLPVVTIKLIFQIDLHCKNFELINETDLSIKLRDDTNLSPNKLVVKVQKQLIKFWAKKKPLNETVRYSAVWISFSSKWMCVQLPMHFCRMKEEKKRLGWYDRLNFRYIMTWMKDNAFYLNFGKTKITHFFWRKKLKLRLPMQCPITF